MCSKSSGGKPPSYRGTTTAADHKGPIDENILAYSMQAMRDEIDNLKETVRQIKRMIIDATNTITEQGHVITSFCAPRMYWPDPERPLVSGQNVE
jgi:hypothetical protein